MEMHMSQCQHRPVQCQKCGNMFPYSLMWQHQGLCQGKHMKNSNNAPVSTNIQRPSIPQVQPIQINQNNSNNSSISEIYVEGFKNFLKSTHEKITTQGTRISNLCNNFIEENKGPMLQKFNAVKNKLWTQIQDVFIRIATDPNF